MSLFSDPKVLRRYVLVASAATLALFTFWAVARNYFQAPPGDYEVRQGDILLSDGDYEKALERFSASLNISPSHRGAMMGRAISLMQSGRLDEAEVAFGNLITFLESTLDADDPTGRGTLAAAYANRGILFDRERLYQKALADYLKSLEVDQEVVEGPGLIDKILYGTPDPATVRKRAEYLTGQLALPEKERLLRLDEKDAEQRMYKP
jgi:tetratricopeptide (TPR) repeat protein